MTDPQKLNGAPAPGAQSLQIPEGDRYLFVRMGRDKAFNILFSDAEDAILLESLASEWIQQNIKIPTVRPPAAAATGPHVAIPSGLDLGSLGRRLRKG